MCVCPWPFYLFWLKLAPRPGIPLQAHDEENGPDIIENHVFYMCVTLKTIQEVSYTYKEPDRRTTMLGEIRQMMEVHIFQELFIAYTRDPSRLTPASPQNGTGTSTTTARPRSWPSGPSPALSPWIPRRFSSSLLRGRRVAPGALQCEPLPSLFSPSRTWLHDKNKTTQQHNTTNSLF